MMPALTQFNISLIYWGVIIVNLKNNNDNLVDDLL